MANFQPPPTYALPILINEKTNEATFNPIWLKWFLDLVGVLDAIGAGGGIPISGLDPSGGTEDQVIKINGAGTGFDFASPGYVPFILAGRVFGKPSPVIPGVRAGTNVTVTRDAGGYIIASTAGAPVWDTDQNMLANQVYGG